MHEAPVPGNTKLAIDPAAPANDRCLIETRGEGGYALAPGSPPECHENNDVYVRWSGPFLTELPSITAEERETLWRCARSFDREVKQEPTPRANGRARSRATDGLRPGEDYDRRGPDWSDILEPHGWALAHRHGEGRYWRRPGKKGHGWSATTGVCHGQDGADLLRVFSSNAAPFEEGKAYGKFRAVALLDYHGDYAAAARELAQNGYGTARPGRCGSADGTSPPPRPVQSHGPPATVPPLHFTDRGNGERLALWHGTDLRHCHPWKKWLAWDGCRWSMDDAGEVMARAKAVTVRLFGEAVEGMKQIQSELEALGDG
jgi:hypothetical protein